MHADIVFKNGQVVTVDPQESIVEAVAVKGNRIIAVGGDKEVSPYINDQTEIVDLQGKSLLPGFIDSHVHLIIHAFTKIAINCRESNFGSINNLLHAIKERANQTPPGEWIIVANFYEPEMAENRYPTRAELDQAAKDHPVFIMRMDIHNSVLNSKALELAGIDENTPNPIGGIIDRDENGIPTGVLRENAHFEVFQKTRPSDDVLMPGIARTQEEFSAFGITSIHEAGGYGPDDFRLMQKASKQGVVKSRIWAFVLSIFNPSEVIDKAIDAGIMTGLGDEKFKFGPVKIFIDGGSAGPNIATRQPYSHRPDDYGTLFYTQEEVDEIFIEAHEKGFQLTAHANGDRAIEMMLNSIEKALELHPRDHRHRIEHAGLTQPDLLKRMEKLGIITSPNPGFYQYIGDAYVQFFGERIMHPIKDWLSVGLKPAAGSDTPCVPAFNPLSGIWGAITRKTGSGKVYGPHQRVSLHEAIRLYTWNGAYASFEENIKGSIEVGKLADLVVLNDRILDVPVDTIKDLKVDLTMIDGEVVYKRTNSNNKERDIVANREH